MTARPAKLGQALGTGEFWMGEGLTRGLLLDGTGSFTFGRGTPFEEADGAFALGEQVPFEGWMHDPERGWYRFGAPVIVLEASYKGEEAVYTLKLKIAGKPQALEG